MSGYTERVNGIVDQVFELSLLHDCRAYLLVESSDGIVTFNSVEDPLWPPDDRSLGSLNRSLRRLSSSREILTRATGEERKELIQLLVYISEVAKGPPALEANPTQEQFFGSGDSEGSREDGQGEHGSLQEEDSAVGEGNEGKQRAVEQGVDQEGRDHESYIWSGDSTDWYGGNAQLS